MSSSPPAITAERLARTATAELTAQIARARIAFAGSKTPFQREKAMNDIAWIKLELQRRGVSTSE